MMYFQNLYAAVMTEQTPGRSTLASLSFDTDDPYAVTLGVNGYGIQFARSLLAEGGGEGDVEVYSNDDFYILFLQKQVGLVFEKARVEDFLLATEQMVPSGRESELVDWNAELQNILPPDTDSDGVDTEGE